jgi:hypothetical protein
MDVFTDSLEEENTSIQSASIQGLIESLDPAFDLLLRDFEKDIHALDHIPIENPSLAKKRLIDYLLSSKRKPFIDSLTFSKQGTISIERQAYLKEGWGARATNLKEKFDELDYETSINLGKQLYNLRDLKNLNLSPEILFV